MCQIHYRATFKNRLRGDTLLEYTVNVYPTPAFADEATDLVQPYGGTLLWTLTGDKFNFRMVGGPNPLRLAALASAGQVPEQWGETTRKVDFFDLKADVEALGGSFAKPVPADAVTTSASGLDPDISLAYARLQVARVAAARKLPPTRVQSLVESHRDRPFLGLVGQARINVLLLNMDLDRIAANGPPSGARMSLGR